MDNENQEKIERARFGEEARAKIKSILLKNLAASPSFARFYTEALRSLGVNSNQSIDLAENNFNFRGSLSMAKPAALKTVRHSQHVKVTGVLCGSPAMREEQFCYFHQRMLRGVKTPPSSRLHPIALIEDEESIQASLMEIINALARNHIDLRRADLMLKALYIAVRNSRRTRFNIHDSQMVREVPDYPAPPKPAPPPIPEDQRLRTQIGKNALLEFRARALMTIPTPVIAKSENLPSTAAQKAVQPPAAYDSVMPEKTMKEKTAQEKLPQEKIGPPVTKTPTPSRHALQLWEGTMKKSIPIATAPPAPDPNGRKPAARAGSAPTLKQVAMSHSRRRT
ncbi:MAG TPA: hypothetical protein VI386_24480 [Candidatus Sulfotelmatobacter sp.]